MFFLTLGMTYRDLFRLLIKLFGFFSLLIIGFYILPILILALKYYNFNEDMSFLPLSVFLVVCFIFYFLIVKTNKIIDLFSLDKGFDNEKIELTYLNVKNTIRISLLLFGIGIIILNLREFYRYSVWLFRSDSRIDEYFQTNLELAVFYGINFLLGIIVLLKLRYFSSKLENLLSKE